MRSPVVIMVLGILLSVTLGCTQDNAFEALKQVNKAKGKVDEIDRTFSKPICELEAATYELKTQVIGFEVKSNTGLEMGFDLLKGFFRLMGLSFKAETGELKLAINLKQSLNPQYDLANVIGESKLSRRDFSFNFNIQQIAAGITHYYETPLSDLAQKGLESGLSKMDKAIAGLENPWSTNIVALPDEGHAVVPVGSFAGLQVGDTFDVYNIKHVWDGAPCESEYLLEMKSPAQAVAVAEVIQVEANAALLRLELTDAAPPVEEGAKLEVRKLLGAKRLPLKRQVRLHPVEGGRLQFEQGISFNINEYMDQQIRAVVHEHNFMVRE